VYRVFLSHNTTPNEMAAVWRLQTLAAASGVHIEVPDATQRRDSRIIEGMISGADAVMALMTRRATKHVHDELTYAINAGKRVIPIVEPGTLTQPMAMMFEKTGTRVFELDPSRPWEMEERLADFLKARKYKKDFRDTIVALAGTVVGLLLLQELTNS
jgi:hypothetical protein